MGFTKKHHQVEVNKDSEGRKWVIAGIGIRTQLKPISTLVVADEAPEADGGGARSTTPTARESRIPEAVTCPPAPRKRRSSRCRVDGGVEFFCPPDLESVFLCHAERAPYS